MEGINGLLVNKQPSLTNLYYLMENDVDDWFSENPQRALAECLLQVLIAKGE